MEKCPLCGGEKKQGYTIYSVDLKFGVVVASFVPGTKVVINVNFSAGILKE